MESDLKNNSSIIIFFNSVFLDNTTTKQTKKAHISWVKFNFEWKLITTTAILKIDYLFKNDLNYFIFFYNITISYDKLLIDLFSREC